MTANENDMLRAEFERWARPRWSHHPEAFDIIPGRPEPEYNHDGVQAAWVGWQAAIAALAAPEGWQPIETAPKDAYEILLSDGDDVCCGFWHDGSECYGHRGSAGWFDSGDRDSLLTASNYLATHWQPLPAAPAAGVPTR